MVLDAGKIVEFGKPSELLEIKDGRPKVLVMRVAVKMPFRRRRSETRWNGFLGHLSHPHVFLGSSDATVGGA